MGLAVRPAPWRLVTSMAKKIRRGIHPLRDGPKRSRVRVGWRPFVFFAVAALLVGAYAIAINLDLQDRINAYNSIYRDWEYP